MDEEVVIHVENVYKDFILPHERAGSVKGVFTSMFSKATRVKEKQHALKDISFEVKKGEFFGIVGRNGSGKSTLLKILANIYQPTKGLVSTSGKLVPFIELGVGFNPELSGRDNVYLNGAILGFSEKEVDDMYDSIVEFAELGRFMDQKLKNYSSGMQVRLAFSAAVRANADILLIDEVLAVGDADFQRKCYEYFNHLIRVKKTVIFVSHDMDAVQKYCNRVMLIENSRIDKIGNTIEVAEEYFKIFAEEKNNKQSEGKRWGDKKMVITNIDQQAKNKKIIIREHIEVKKEVEGAVFGVRVRSTSGQSVTGTNSEFEKKPLTKLNKGTKLLVEWKIPNIFSDGNYLLDLSLTYNNGVVADWWDEATEITVTRDRHLPYSVDPEIELSILNL